MAICRMKKTLKEISVEIFVKANQGSLGNYIETTKEENCSKATIEASGLPMVMEYSWNRFIYPHRIKSYRLTILKI